jgi:hypothetical protein
VTPTLLSLVGESSHAGRNYEMDKISGELVNIPAMFVTGCRSLDAAFRIAARKWSRSYDADERRLSRGAALNEMPAVARI